MDGVQPQTVGSRSFEDRGHRQRPQPFTRKRLLAVCALLTEAQERLESLVHAQSRVPNVVHPSDGEHVVIRARCSRGQAHDAQERPAEHTRLSWKIGRRRDPPDRDHESAAFISCQHDHVVNHQCGFVGCRVGEVSNAGPSSNSALVRPRTLLQEQSNGQGCSVA